MKIVLTIQLQQNNGDPVFTGTKTKNNFVLADVEPTVLPFVVSSKVKAFLYTCGEIADGEFLPSGTPTITF